MNPTSFYPQHHLSFWYNGIIRSGTAFIYFMDIGYIYATATEQETAALNDEVEFQFYLRKGSYTLEIIGQAYNQAGIQTVYLNSTSIGTVDWYNAANTANVKKTITFTVPSSGLQILNFKVTSKNASSTNYFCTITLFKVYPT